MYQCTHCGRPADILIGCPYCGQPAPPLSLELERLNRDIAEMSARDLAIQRERSELSAKMQAALHQRALLHSAQNQRLRRTPKQRATARRVTPRRVAALLPPPARPSRRTDAATPPPATDRAAAEPGPEAVPATSQPAGLRAEASWRSMQNVLLALGALLLGVAALTFTVAVLAELDDVGRAAILVVICAAVLMVPPVVVRRRLTATAETVTSVGLLLMPLAGHAFWQIDTLRASLAIPASSYAGAVCLTVVAAAMAYQRATGLTAPRYAALLALQPAVPLLAYEWVNGPAGWALVLSAVAGADVLAGRALGRRPPSVGWLREAAWILHGVAVGAALVYATAALATSDTLPAVARAAGTLVLAAGVGLAGALSLRHRPLPDIAAAVMTLAVIGSSARVATVALPGRALVVVAGAVALTAAAVRALPAAARRGPQLASSAALVVLGVAVAAAVARAAAAPLRAVLPPWEADLARYGERLADAVGPAGWQIAVSAALLTLAAGLAVPAALRHSAAVAGAAMTALATPAAFGLDWQVTPWALLLAAVALALTGFAAPTVPAARAHVAAASVVGLAAAAASLAEPALTAGVLTALTAAAALIGFAPRSVTGGRHPTIIAGAGQGAAAASLPGAVAATIAAAWPGVDAPPVLAASFLAVCGALGYAALAQVSTRQPNQPVVLGGTLSSIAVAVGAYGADTATIADLGVATLLVVSALTLWLVPSINANRRPDRYVDGADLAAAAVTAGALAALTRSAALVAPGAELAATAALLLAVAFGVRAMPAHWRAGPILGCAVGGGLVAAAAGYGATTGALRVIIATDPIWATDLANWSATVGPGRGVGWQAPAALLLLAAAAGTAMPPRPRAVLVPALVALAVIGTPAAFGLPWWSPTVLGLAVGTVLGVAGARSAGRRSGVARTWAAAALGGYAVGASLVQAWATASALAGVTTAGLLIAGNARAAGTAPPAGTARPEGTAPPEGATEPDGVSTAPRSPTHQVRIGGAAVVTTLLALPAALACTAASVERPAGTALRAALAAACLGLAMAALLSRHIDDYLPYATVGTATASTAVALTAAVTGQPYGVYAAAAALLGVLSELVRSGAATDASRARVTGPVRAWPIRWTRSPGPGPERNGLKAGVLTSGVLAAAGLPALLALASIAPALTAVLVEPHRTLSHVWAGQDAAGVDWTGPASGAAVSAALVLTLAAALAAAGFGERAVTRLSRDEVLAQVVPVVLPGVAVTLLIAPAGLGLGWPAGTTGALSVFAISMLGVALTPPPPAVEAARPVRVTRALVLAIGLVAGGAGLAGSLAAKWLTLATLAGAVGVGLTAALLGRTHNARILGWAFAAASAHALAYASGAAAGLAGPWAALGVMTVAALALVVASVLPGLQRVSARGEAPALEWSGYAGGLVSLVLAAGSLAHLAALLAAWGAVLGIAAVRPSRPGGQRRVLLWAALGCELAAWWLVMRIADIGLIEAYTLPFAALALLIGLIELRYHPELGSWAAYGPALGTAFVPTLAIVLATDTSPARRIALLLGAVATLIAGSRARQRAPVVVGSVVTAIAALHELITVSVWLIFIPIGVLLLVLGANYEKRSLRRIRGALGRMR